MSFKEEQLEKLIDSAEINEHIAFGRCLTITYRLPNNFIILGKSICVSSTEFDITIGRTIARKDAIRQLKECLAYLLYEEKSIVKNVVDREPKKNLTHKVE